MRHKWLFCFVVAVFLGAAAGAYWILPKVLFRQINGRLQGVPGYDGGVEGLRLEWTKPRLVLRGFRFAKRDEAPPGAFLSADEARADLSWKQLLRGNLVLDVTVEKPRIEFLLRQRNVGDPRRFGLWQGFFARMPAFWIRRLSLNDAVLRFRNEQAIPLLEVSFDDVQLTAENLANRARLPLRGPALVEGRGLLMGHAPVTLSVKAERFQEHPVFELRGGVKDFDLTFLNGFVRHYTGMELKSGRLNMSGEFAAQDGEFRGQARRRVENLDVSNKSRGFIKEALLQTWLDWHVDVHGTENGFQLSGPLGYMDKDIYLAVVWVAKSAFVHSLRAKLPGEVRLPTPEEAQDKWAAAQARAREKAAARP